MSIKGRIERAEAQANPPRPIKGPLICRHPTSNMADCGNWEKCEHCSEHTGRGRGPIIILKGDRQ
jgi:hypothetical protein